MVSDYSDAGQERWLAGQGIDLLRGTGRLAGPGVVEVDGVRHTARARRAWRPAPIRSCRRSRACASSTGVWGTREATGMKAVPRRLLVLGGGPVGRRDGAGRCGASAARWSLVEGAAHVLAREPAPLGEALGEALRRDGIELRLGVQRRRRAARRRGLRPGSSTTAASCAATGCWWRPAGGPRVEGIGLETVGVQAGPARDPGRRAPARGRAAVGDRRRHRHLAADPRRRVPGRGRRVEHRSASRARRNYEAVPRVIYTDPQAAAVGAAEAAFSATVLLSEVPRPPPTPTPTPNPTGS